MLTVLFLTVLFLCLVATATATAVLLWHPAALLPPAPARPVLPTTTAVLVYMCDPERTALLRRTHRHRTVKLSYVPMTVG